MPRASAVAMAGGAFFWVLARGKVANERSPWAGSAGFTWSATCEASTPSALASASVNACLYRA